MFSVAFGRAGSPLIWESAAAFLGRSGQASFSPSEARLEVYVDDPLLVLLKGTQPQRTRNLAVFVLWWLALGPDLSWNKVQRCTEVNWIGDEISAASPRSATITLPTSSSQNCSTTLTSSWASHIRWAAECRSWEQRNRRCFEFWRCVLRGQPVSYLFWSDAGAHMGGSSRTFEPRDALSRTMHPTAKDWISVCVDGIGASTPHWSCISHVPRRQVLR